MTQSLKVAGPSLLRRYAWSSGVDDLADLRQFQLEEDDYDVRSSDLPGELSSVQTADSQPFEQIPGPRGLPLIGNMLSYSKLGKLTSFIAFVSTTILLHSSLFIFFYLFFLHLDRRTHVGRLSVSPPYFIFYYYMNTKTATKPQGCLGNLLPHLSLDHS